MKFPVTNFVSYILPNNLRGINTNDYKLFQNIEEEMCHKCISDANTNFWYLNQTKASYEDGNLVSTMPSNSVQ